MMVEANQTIFKNWKQFIASNVDRIIQQKLQYQFYDPIKTKQQANEICDQIVRLLSGTNKNFKYITNCTIVAAGGNGLDFAGLCYWDNQMDGQVTVKWQNKNLSCIVNVYGCAL